MEQNFPVPAPFQIKIELYNESASKGLLKKYYLLNLEKFYILAQSVFEFSAYIFFIILALIK